jgi:L-xylulokinase
LFADALGMPIAVTKIDEAAAFGAALCAGAAIGRYASPGDGARGLVGVGMTYEPNAERNQELDARYAVYARLADALNPLWPDIEALGAAPRDRP